MTRLGLFYVVSRLDDEHTSWCNRRPARRGTRQPDQQARGVRFAGSPSARTNWTPDSRSHDDFGEDAAAGGPTWCSRLRPPQPPVRV